MGFQFRRSFKIAPGVRINLGKKGVGLSVGGKGAHISVNSSGRVTKTVGIPGTGLRYQTSTKLGAQKKRHAPPRRTAAGPARAERTERTESAQTEPPVSHTGECVIEPLQMAPLPEDGKTPNKGHMRRGVWIAVLVCGLLLAFQHPLLGLVGTAGGLFGLARCARAHEYTAGRPVKKMPRRAWVWALLGLYLVLAGSGLQTRASVSPAAPADYSAADESSLQARQATGGASAAAPQTGAVAAGTASTSAAASAGQSASASSTGRSASSNTGDAASSAQPHSPNSAKPSAAQSSAVKTNGKIVYVTPSGKRYHFSKSCAGKKAKAISIDDIGSRTPCKKCADG